MINSIQVTTVSDGGNPRNDFDIQRREEDFYLFPFSEDGDANYKFHLNVKVINDSDQTLPVRFTVNWGDELYQCDRSYLLLCTDDHHWQIIDVQTKGTQTSGIGQVPPGISYLCFHPRYEHGRFVKLVNSLPSDLFTVKKIGLSRQHRDILAIEAGNAAKPSIAIYTRVHPYETIGSYLTEGMLRWLSQKSEEALELLNQYRLLLVPMPNVDGVADGTNKLTHGGLNFSSNFRPSVEPEAIALKEYITQNNPQLLLDLHGWNNPWENLATNDGKIGKEFYRFLLEKEALFYKPIELYFRKDAWDLPDHSCSYFASTLGTRFINSSWSHVGRDANQLYAMGTTLLQAAANALNLSHD